MPGVLALKNGSTRATLKSPPGVGVRLPATKVAGVKVGPSVDVGVFVEGGINEGVTVAMVEVGAGVLVYKGNKVEAQPVTPWLFASSTMLRTAARPVLVL